MIDSTRGKRRAIVATAAAVAIAVALAVSWSQRSPLVIDHHAVADVAPGSSSPRFVLAVIVSNSSDEPVEIIGEPQLAVRSVNTGGHLDVVATPIDPQATTIGPDSRVEVLYDLWRLGNLYGNGIFVELRRAPDEMRFRLKLETNAGSFETDEWSGLSAGSDVAKFLSELRAGSER